MTIVLHHLAALLVAAVVVLWLWHGRWTHAHPRTALVLWQVVGLTVVVSTVGALLGIGLAPYRRGQVPALGALASELAAGEVWRTVDPAHLGVAAAGLALACWLIGNQVVCLVRTNRLRARHRAILNLVAHSAADALVVDHPIAVAYCLPGRTPRIVVSAGTRHLLTGVELDAVLAHERAHARERHDLVLAPFHALRRLWPGGRLLGRACTAIALLVEMCADDRAASQHGAEPLASALERFHRNGFGGTPAGALAAMDDNVEARIRRLRYPVSASWAAPIRLLGVLVALVALGTSASLFAVPA
ncbi:M56 family metallopeptidase [Amycolatopsis cihanbeyliensis]|uniref:Peptidase M48-like protein n=1 Tax=Amycolatopsis cihanbeyliensis TaxID=1128664 RepID=A0A542DK22_AMYCI|nr:M56 family metallopeptidase [Amycolatopsis cihanbeyliensis]TQJ03451.1 peptidase M48-like protein [Amycolatopsis cihanbeyliensis]